MSLVGSYVRIIDPYLTQVRNDGQCIPHLSVFEGPLRVIRRGEGVSPGSIRVQTPIGLRILYADEYVVIEGMDHGKTACNCEWKHCSQKSK